MQKYFIDMTVRELMRQSRAQKMTFDFHRGREQALYYFRLDNRLHAGLWRKEILRRPFLMYITCLLLRHKWIADEDEGGQVCDRCGKHYNDDFVEIPEPEPDI
jgi:hypothetical protein